MEAGQGIQLGQDWSRLHSWLLVWFARRLPCEQECQDCVSECLVRAWERFGRFFPPDPYLHRWLLRVAKSVLVDGLRHRRRRPIVGLPEVCDSVSWRGDERALEGLLEDLPGKSRQAVRMLAAGADPSEVCSTFGWSDRSYRRCKSGVCLALLGRE